VQISEYLVLLQVIKSRNYVLKSNLSVDECRISNPVSPLLTVGLLLQNPESSASVSG
jgi:hypothetical protein